MHQPYFVQTNLWAGFWQSANAANHSYFWLESSVGNHTLKFLVYSYPWHLGQNFWYISKGGVLIDSATNSLNDWSSITVKDLEKLLIKLLKKTYQDAGTNNIPYIKIDFEEELVQALKLSSNQEVLKLLQNQISKDVVISDKIVQFLSTMTLDFRNINHLTPKIEPLDKVELTNLWNDTQEFWKTTNSNAKRYTKKSIDQDWVVSTKKTEQNFEKFFKIYNHTKETRNFAIQTREYLQNLYNQEFSRIIILSDAQGEPHCVWFGICIGNTLTYLYGGNTDHSFDKYGQYLVHLVAVNQGLKDKVNFYDLGGYDSTKGYGRFKENYKGVIRTFPGAFDIPVNFLKFQAINVLIIGVKKIKAIIKK